MADTAEHAWGHCLAVLRDAGPAEEVAVAAVRRGGRSRSAVLAHARALALARTATGGPAGAPADDLVPPDLDPVGLAVLLAGLRPEVERCLVDLDGRLDRIHLARALGMTPAEAAARVAEIAATWERELDPALLAWLGPGDCEELAGLLADGPPPTLGAGLAAAPLVAGHVEGCEVCSDRRRSMMSVRALQAQAQVPPVPRAVKAAATAGLLRLPGPWPAPLDGPRASRRRWRWVAAATALVVPAALFLLSRGRDHPHQAFLTPANALAVAPAGLSANGWVALRDTSTHSVAWQATASADWLTVDPTSGRLGPGQVVQLQIAFLAGAPPGGARASVGIAGSDGSAAQIDATGPIVQNPDLAATAEGCTVRAQVVDTTDATVTLHYRLGDDPAVHDIAFAGPATGSTATLPTGPRPITWWVTAVDRAGGQARTLEQTASLAAC